MHRNLDNNKCYIGVTCQKPEYRWKRNGTGYIECPYFYNAILKHGWHRFEHLILFTHMTQQEAFALEKHQISELKTNNTDFGYNISNGGDGLSSEEAKQLWMQNDFRNNAVEKMREAWKDPIKRKRRSEAMRERWQNQDFKDKFVKSISQVCGSGVECIETHERFNIMKDACEKYGINHSNLCRAIRTGYKCGGFHWKYISETSVKA